MEISVIGRSRVNLGRYNLGFCSCSKILNSKMGDSKNSKKLKGRNLCQVIASAGLLNLPLVAALEPPPLHKMELLSFLRNIQNLQEPSFLGVDNSEDYVSDVGGVSCWWFLSLTLMLYLCKAWRTCIICRCISGAN